VDRRAVLRARLALVASFGFLTVLPVPAQEVPARAGAAPAASSASKAPPPPEPLRRLDVTVRDDAGVPVEGAVVVATPSSGGFLPLGGYDSDKVRATLTGAAGRATLDSLPPGPWTLAVQAEGFAPQRVRRVSSGPVDVRLERGGVVTGVVHDSEGRPVAGARVAIDTGLPLPTEWVERASRVETATNAEGRFRLEGIGRTPVQVSARAPGFGRAEREKVEAGAHVELFLFAGATLTGSVVDAEGQPLKGALVQAAGGGLWSTSPPAERTGEDGSFVMAGVDPGEYVVMAGEGARAPGLARAVVEEDADTDVRVVVNDGGFVTGRLVDPEGQPLAGRARVVSFEGLTLPGFASDRMSTEVRGDGRFALGPLPPGALQVRVAAAGYASKRLEAFVPEAGATVELGRVALDTGLTIRGRVIDAEESGIEGAKVSATPESATLDPPAEATSDDGGAFVVRGLEEDAYELSVSAPGYATLRVGARAGDADVELRLEGAGDIRGRVVDAEGRAAPDARIRAEPADASSHFPGRVYGSVEDDEGHFVLRDVAAGTFILHAEASGRGEASRSGVRVTAGATTDAGTMVLARGGVIRGTVVQTDGSGVPGATVQADRDAHSRSGRLRTQGDSSGRFEIGGVPPGRFAVSASHPAFAPSRPVVAEVDPQAEPEPVRLVLSRGGRIEGQAVHRDGRPFVEGRIMTYGMGLDRANTGSETVPVGADGWFSADHLPPGRTQVNLMAWTSSSPMVSGGPANILTGVASREVEVRDGETSAVDFRVHDTVVTGQVTRGDRPAPGVRISLTGQGSMVFSFVGSATPGTAISPPGPPPLTATTREDGRYELVVFSPGQWQVQMEELAAGRLSPGRQLVIPDVDVFTLDLELADTAVSGVLVDADSGEPVSGVVNLMEAKPGGTWAGSGGVSREGRFTVLVQPGDYRLTARAPGRKEATLEVSVGPGGVDDLRVELERGLSVRGRVVDASGRPVGEVTVLASGPESGHRGGHARTLADGSFLLDGLEDEEYTLTAGSELAGFAVVAGVTPGDEPILLRLRPAGRVAVRVLDAAGLPVQDAYPRVRTVGGVPVRVPGLSSAPTDPSGVVELPAPAGTVEMEVRGVRGTVTVRPGETVSLDLVLAPASASP